MGEKMNTMIEALPTRLQMYLKVLDETNGYALIALLTTILYAFWFILMPSPINRFPTAGRRSWRDFEILIRFRSFQDSFWILNEICKRPDKPIFHYLRPDTDYVVLPQRYIDDVRLLPSHAVSATLANVTNLVGKYTTTDALLESDMQSRVLQSRLTPSLGDLVPEMAEELDFALNAEIPNCDGNWTPLITHSTILRIVARVSARIFVGPQLCRDKRWIDLSIHYTEHVFRTAITIRFFPHWMHPIISFLIPSAWTLRRNLREAQALIVPLVRERTAITTDVPRANDLLQWMIDATSSHDGEAEKLAHRQLLVSLAAIHTTSMAITHALFDLCARKEYTEPLYDEAMHVLREDGGWKKGTAGKLMKMDSFLKESQRLSPPSLLTMNRIALQDLSFSDGVRLPRGTRFCMPAYEILNDSIGIPNSDVFDGLRYYKQRQAPGQEDRHQFASTDRNNLHFGYGRYACPGRHFAAQEIKMIVAEFLVRYEIRWEGEGEGGGKRPRIGRAFEYVFPDPKGVVFFRERRRFIGMGMG